MNVLLAVDGSDYTRRAVDYVLRHDWLARNGRLSVFTVALPVPHRAAAMAGPALTHAYYQDDAEVLLRPAREALAGLGPQVSYGWTIGHPADAIVRKAAEEDADLIVMGSHGHGALASVVLGSVATRVLATCKVPVLLIR
jgi:nucleotide-binding universal stress UspA family protein